MISVFIIVGMIICLTGCSNQIPDLSEEDQNLVSEYAAQLLLKYDENFSPRLMTEEMVSENAAAEVVKEEVVGPVSDNLPTSSENTISNEQTQTEEVTSLISGAQKMDLAKFLGLESLSISYIDSKTYDIYPEKENEILTVNAEPGTKIVVSRFAVANTSATDVICDMLNKEVTYEITFDGEKKYKVLTTMLLDDFTTYSDTILANETKELVFLTEVPEEVSQIDRVFLLLTYQEQSVVVDVNP